MAGPSAAIFAQDDGAKYSGAIAARKDGPGLNVKFQEVVVHSVENWEAEVANKQLSQETEWTITIMLD